MRVCVCVGCDTIRAVGKGCPTSHLRNNVFNMGLAGLQCMNSVNHGSISLIFNYKNSLPYILTA